ncbi:hypothetical protein Syn6312_3196 [Synechococcus sp. PCC 6312]|nr:hypothetical protein Syn6312_3196 [Synechococcus sp. PCC 6312]
MNKLGPIGLNSLKPSCINFYRLNHFELDTKPQLFNFVEVSLMLLTAQIALPRHG